jgi:hypothetical protein
VFTTSIGRFLLRRRYFRREVRDDRVVAGEHGLLRANATELAASHVIDGHAGSAGAVLDVHSRGIQSQSHRRSRPVEGVVVEPCRHDREGIGIARHFRECAGHQRTDEQPRNRAVAVRKHCGVAVVLGLPVVADLADDVASRQARPEAFGDGEMLGRNAPEAGRRVAENLQGLVRQAEVPAQEIGVARAMEVSRPLLRGLAFQHLAI